MRENIQAAPIVTDTINSCHNGSSWNSSLDKEKSDLYFAVINGLHLIHIIQSSPKHKQTKFMGLISLVHLCSVKHWSQLTLCSGATTTHRHDKIQFQTDLNLIGYNIIYFLDLFGYLFPANHSRQFILHKESVKV